MTSSANGNPYASAGVDTAAGDLAVELMKASVAKTHGAEVFGGVGGFAGLFDASALKNYQRPLLASSTDGVGTKVAIAQAIDKHDTIGQDLVGMVVDDIVVVGARPLVMTDYIATGKLEPTRIADIVRGIAEGCQQVGVALVGGETAEHPGLLRPHEYDVAGAAVGVVEAAELLGPEKVLDGDAVISIASSGLHSNGFSLVRKIVADAGLKYTDHWDEFGRSVGEELLEPTRLYTADLLAVLAEPSLRGAVRALSHITGGGIAANLARVMPANTWIELDRGAWNPPQIFRSLAAMGGHSLESLESTWNLGIGFMVVVDPSRQDEVIAFLQSRGHDAWLSGTISSQQRSFEGFEVGGKGVAGGAVRLVGSYR